MARDKRLTRQPSGPGRSTRRPRSAALPAEQSAGSAPGTGKATAAPASARSSAPSATDNTAGRRGPRRPRGLAFTRRALILFAVVALLGLSYASSLRVLFTQSSDLATAQAQIEERTARASDLEQELQRWQDPAYVKVQARTRMGWVMPGEIGYRVIGTDGQVVSGSEEIEGVGSARTSELHARWWEHLAGSVNAADDPQPVGR